MSSVELPKGEKALADEGAVRDVAASLSEGLRVHLADLHRRLPGLTGVVVQVDEPLLAAVVAGEMPTASGWGRIRIYEREMMEGVLRQVLGAAAAGAWPPGPSSGSSATNGATATKTRSGEATRGRPRRRLDRRHPP